MKKTSIILTLAAMLVAMVSCTKEEQPVSGQFTMTVNADKGSRATKDLSLDGTTLNAMWKVDEQVKVYKGSTELGTLTAASDGVSTILSGTIEGEIAENEYLTLKFLSGNYGSQTGTLAYIAANCDYATASVKINSISDGSVSTTDAVFQNQQAIVKFTLQKSDHSVLPSNPTALTINYGTGSVTLTSIPADTYTTNGDGVLYVALPGFSNQNVTLTATMDSDTYTKTVSNITFANGQYYTITVGLTQAVTGHALSLAAKGDIICSDGLAYAGTDYNNLPSGVTAVALVIYVGSNTDDNTYNHGLALALVDEGELKWSSAKSACEGKTAVANASWVLASQSQWLTMLEAATSAEALRNGFSSVGGTNMLEGTPGYWYTDSHYWTRTPFDETHYYMYSPYYGDCEGRNETRTTLYVRACLVF